MMTIMLFTPKQQRLLNVKFVVNARPVLIVLFQGTICVLLVLGLVFVDAPATGDFTGIAYPLSLSKWHRRPERN